jgi:hypothetical protein
VQPEADKNPEGDAIGRDTQVEASAVQTTTTAGTTRGDVLAEAYTVEMAVADAAVIHHEAEIPQQPEV